MDVQLGFLLALKNGYYILDAEDEQFLTRCRSKAVAEFVIEHRGSGHNTLRYRGIRRAGADCYNFAGVEWRFVVGARACGNDNAADGLFLIDSGFQRDLIA